MKRVLCINSGSTSLKIERYELTDPLPEIGNPPAPIFSENISMQDAKAALQRRFAEGIDLVAHRIVRLPQHMPPCVPLDDARMAEIEAENADAPLHNAPALRLARLIHELDSRIVQIGVSDSAFHRTLSPAAKTYAIPRASSESGLVRVGYHGLSHEYAAHRAAVLAETDIAGTRVITAHLGGGSSLCAVFGGHSIDTTMGFTPLDGIPMATRSGAVDPGIIFHLLRAGKSADEIEHMLEKESGLLGISQRSGDVRELLAASDDQAATLALEVFAWRARAAIGGLIATLGGIDLLVFTGGIGEHAPMIREAILKGGLGLGFALDPRANLLGKEGGVSAPKRPPVMLVSAREGWQLARLAIAYSSSS
jgi:acetate kinase